MTTFVQYVRRFSRSDDGPTATEYAVLLAIISMTVLLAMGGFGAHMEAIYAMINGTLPS